MARLFYGGSGADVIARRAGGDDDTLQLALDVTYDVYTARTGGSVLTDLLDADGAAITEVIPDESGVRFQGPDGATADLWLQNQGDLTEPRWLVKPAGRDLSAEWEAYQAGATVVLKSHRAMNLRDEVTPSGVDDTATVNAALATFDAAGGGVLEWPADDWKFTGATGLALIDTENPIHIVFDDGVVLDMTNLTAATGMLLGGSLGADEPLDNDADAGDLTIDCTLAVTAGDIIQILSTEVWSSEMAASRHGEMAEVVSTDGTTITLRSPIYGWYAAADTTVTLMKAPRVSVEGDYSILRDSNHAGLKVQYARDVLLGGGYGEGARERLFNLANVYGYTADGLRGRDFWYSGTGTSYGLVIGSSQHGTERSLDLRGGRHALSHGGTFPCRDILTDGGTFDNEQRTLGCVDFHPNSEYVKVVKATILNGLASQAGNAEYDRCEISTPPSSAMDPVSITLAHDSDYVRINCDVRAGDPDANAIEIVAAVGTTKLVEIRGRLVSGQDGGYGIRVVQLAAAAQNNTIERLRVLADIESGADSVRIPVSSGAFELAIPDVDIAGRHRTNGTGGHGTQVTNPDVERVNFDGWDSVTTKTNRSNYLGSAVGPDVTMRRFKCTAEASGSGNAFGTGKLIIDGGTLDGHTSNGGITAASASEALIANVERVGTSGTPTLPNRNYSKRNVDGTVETHGTAAPSAGTWSRGDKCWNSTPSAAGAPGWVCTTAGTPGTWKAMANVAA